MAESKFLWMSALAAARRDAVSSPGGRLAACFRSISSAAERRPWFCFSASALRFASSSACAWRSRSASPLRRTSSSSLRRRSASACSYAFCSSSILREKASRPARKSGAGAPGPDGLRGSLAIPCIPNADAANDTLPRTRCARSAAPHAAPRFGVRTSSASATPSRGCGSLRCITGGSLRTGELLQREGVADVVERLVAGEAFGVVHAGPVLLVGGEHGVVPILVAQHFGNVLAPARVSRHGRVGDELLRDEVAVGACGRLAVGAELRRMHFGEQNRAVRERLARLRRRHRGLVGEGIAHLLGRGKAYGVVLGERLLVAFGEGHIRLCHVGKLCGL